MSLLDVKVCYRVFELVVIVQHFVCASSVPPIDLKICLYGGNPSQEQEPEERERERQERNANFATLIKKVGFPDAREGKQLAATERTATPLPYLLTTTIVQDIKSYQCLYRNQSMQSKSAKAETYGLLEATSMLEEKVL